MRQRLRDQPPFRGRGVLDSAEVYAEKRLAFEKDQASSAVDDGASGRLKELEALDVQPHGVFDLFPLFPIYSEDWLDNAIAELCYHPYGGGGLAFGAQWVENLPIGRIEYYLRWLDERRADERRAIERAGKKK